MRKKERISAKCFITVGVEIGIKVKVQINPGITRLAG
jgi:hypothetical protein